MPMIETQIRAAPRGLPRTKNRPQPEKPVAGVRFECSLGAGG